MLPTIIRHDSPYSQAQPPPAPVVMLFSATDLHLPTLPALIIHEDLYMKAEPAASTPDTKRKSSKVVTFTGATVARVVHSQPRSSAPPASSHRAPTPSTQWRPTPVCDRSLSPLSSVGSEDESEASLGDKIAAPIALSRQTIKKHSEWIESDEQTKKITAYIKKLADSMLDKTQAFTNQNDNKVKQLYRQTNKEFPCMQRYQDNWATKCILQAHLKIKASAAKNHAKNKILHTLSDQVGASEQRIRFEETLDKSEKFCWYGIEPDTRFDSGKPLNKTTSSDTSRKKEEERWRVTVAVKTTSTDTSRKKKPVAVAALYVGVIHQYERLVHRVSAHLITTPCMVATDVFWTKVDTRVYPEAYACLSGKKLPDLAEKNGLDPFQFLNGTDDDAIRSILRRQWEDNEEDLWGGPSSFDHDLPHILNDIKTYSCKGWPLAPTLAPSVTVFGEYGNYLNNLAYILFKAVATGIDIITVDGTVMTLLSAKHGIWKHIMGDILEDDFWVNQPSQGETLTSWGPVVAENVWVLLDGQKATDGNYTSFIKRCQSNFFVIYASSPNKERTAWIGDHISFRLIMQPPLWKELVAAFCHITVRTVKKFDASMKEEMMLAFPQLRENFATFGPQARVLSKALFVSGGFKDIQTGLIQQAVAQLNPTQLLPEYAENVPHTLFRVVRCPRTSEIPQLDNNGLDRYWFKPPTLEIQSPPIRQLLLADTRKTILKIMEQYTLQHNIKYSGSRPELIGGLWQDISLKVICGAYKYSGPLVLKETNFIVFTSKDKQLGADGMDAPAHTFYRVTCKEWIRKQKEKQKEKQEKKEKKSTTKQKR
ncbi:hypothetical protein DFH07DRAFT_773397 [Mycena maculata]|uniref:Uncharacterized protein n=1 Tax=Mycena maculata TaxID=230809 RepID=A0AAD7J279_9AGAR|nr:hypothetical protein DFH07DRAFT_773397 [Mycena maculata]